MNYPPPFFSTETLQKFRNRPAKSSKSMFSVMFPNNIIQLFSKISVFVFVFLALQNKVLCFSFSYTRFLSSDTGNFRIADNSSINAGALQVTFESNKLDFHNISGRILYNKKFRLHNNKRVASFNSTFVLNITPRTNGGGEGIAFILSKDYQLPSNSEGQWLGIVNANTNGSSDSNIVAIEFDTRKSFPEDVDGNHVGLDINSVYSKYKQSLNASGVNLTSGNDITAMIRYNALTKMMKVFVINGSQTGSNLSLPIFSEEVVLAEFLPDEVYVGFSASTGSGSELNCVKSWFFVGEEIGTSKSWVLITVVAVSSWALLLCFTGGYLYWRKKRNRRDTSDDEDTIIDIDSGMIGPKKIKLEHLKTATGNFNPKNELGRGGFGVVYRGNWNGIEVAVKRSMVNTAEGKQNLIAEVTSIGSVRHKNVVKLIGWCHESKELLLVYEYMPNGSLDKYIYSGDEKLQKDNPVPINWEGRHKIICGVAQAVDYLHNECSKRVLHRDIKPSNVMLDSEFNACLGDFGLARMFRLSETTHHSTQEIAGTPGYIAPEIFHTGRASAEADVYAFGVLILVVACGKNILFKPHGCEDNKSIHDWVWELFNLGEIVEAIDPKLKGNFDKGQAECMLVLGLACCHPNPYVRPTMRNALQVLMGDALPPVVPYEKPAFMWPAISPSFTTDDSMEVGMLTTYSSLSERRSFTYHNHP